jgi:hypothetical protein
VLILGVSALLASVASCDSDPLGNMHAGAGEPGLVSAGAEQGGEPGAAGSADVPGGSGGAGSIGNAGAAADNAGQAGQAPGSAGSAGSEGLVEPHLSCPGDPSPYGAGGQGGEGNWSWLDSGAGGAGGESFHRITVGAAMTALAINESGQILVKADGMPSCSAWLLDGGSAQPIEPEPGACVSAIDVNDDGTVLAMHDSRPFFWRAGVVTYLAGVTVGRAVAFNNAEQVLLDNLPAGPALWEGGSLTPLKSPANEPLQPIAINEGGQVLAHIGTLDYSYSTWLWEDGVAVELGLGRADALNDSGVVVGVNIPESLSDRTIGTWRDGTFTPLDLANPEGAPLHGPQEYDELVASAINDRGEIVGTFIPNWEDVDARPFYYVDGVLQFLDKSGRAYDISETGHVVGQHTRRVNASPCCLACEVCGDIADPAAALWVRECPLACCPP